MGYKSRDYEVASFLAKLALPYQLVVIPEIALLDKLIKSGSILKARKFMQRI